MSFKFNLETHHHRPTITDPAHQLALAGLTAHGGIYKLMDPDYVKKRLAGKMLKEGLSADDVVNAAKALFFRLVDDAPYNLHAGLISYLTFPGKGKLATPVDGKGKDVNVSNANVPAFMTFVGQFIDHDLTQNMINLFDPQSGNDITDGASPLIDLDSVYTRSNALSNGDPDDIFDEEMKFILVEVKDSKGKVIGYDHNRDANAKAYIHDARNDENQMISQVHILVERLHNKLMDKHLAAAKKAKGADLFASEIATIFNKVQVEVIRNWQSFLWHQYLPKIVNPKALNWVVTRLLDERRHSELDQKPANGVLNMPHEFAISFRMGHSQLRDRYQVQANADEIFLFEPHDPTHQTDLTGSKHLVASHTIDWHYFGDAKKLPLSNDIDTQVTNRVFDLPESAIPDDDKLIGNLTQRNLIRSSQVDLSNAEFIYDSLHDMASIGPKLKPEQIEKDADSRRLFQLDNAGNYDECNDFRTPLWYYVLKEAEVLEKGAQLGPLGGRIVAGVIAAGIYFSDASFIRASRADKPCKWVSEITKSEKVSFQDIVEFVIG